MVDATRKKSPRAPSLALEDALARALLVYEKERRHEVPVDVVAQDMGYKGSRNGAALAALASLRYFGLVERPREGTLAVTKDVETFKFAPEESARRQLLKKWVTTPPVFAELLEKYSGDLPSDAVIKFDLIQKGFTPDGAEDCMSVFRRSVEFAQYYDGEPIREEPVATSADTQQATASVAQLQINSVPSEQNVDRIPIRLTGNRRAWLEVPIPFYESDKERIKAQVDLLLSDDQEAEV